MGYDYDLGESVIRILKDGEKVRQFLRKEDVRRREKKKVRCKEGKREKYYEDGELLMDVLALKGHLKELRSK